MPHTSQSVKRAFATLALALLVHSGGALAALSPAFAQATAADAATRTARLDALFATLGAATTDSEATAVVAEIWTTWTRSGRPDVDRLMEEAGAGMETQNFGVSSMLLDEVVALAPDFAEGWNRRATLRFTMGDLAGAEADIAKVLALEPRHFGALSSRAMINMRSGLWQQALDAYRAALAANPFLPERHEVVPVLERKAREGRL